ncbi:hypothetical protein Murru_3129 [Allomuricauda ruestringensis DSM 13258]|uniref:Uncharacterized protein n=1 Tax=Allomuricauda ruestringensis (strain DSM 13258 / CIP 107369 / LMG 19739 / B1) TaxID=886377 RepID=G2PL93_ALLRU|nr:hypothetical protein Murru_3129 [Allomuricauda ruestringensis DSM 13258]
MINRTLLNMAIVVNDVMNKHSKDISGYFKVIWKSSKRSGTLYRLRIRAKPNI